ncbi:hypothetical protein SNK03_010843 [Fusarium graminearum]
MPPNLPNEVWSKIFSHLLTEHEKHRLEIHHFGDITNARLVCRLWNDLATKQLFRTLSLGTDVDTALHLFDSWHRFVSSKLVANAARRVAIFSATEEVDGSRYKGNWPPEWEANGEWRAFESAIDRICDMPNLDTIEVRFTSCCAGKDARLLPLDEEEEIVGPELATTRFQTLRAVLRAIETRAERPDTTVIRELVLDNLQNMPLPSTIAPNLFCDIQRLQIKILSENYGYMHPDAERPDLIHREELRQFPSYLQNKLLPSIADQLVELTISGEHWGSIPGEFNGKGLSFPKLKTLTLDGYDILRKDQFQWVLEQQALTALHLHNCTIATHCHAQQPEFALWNVNLHGWSKVNAYRLGPAFVGWYESSLRWDTVFHSICESLPLLKRFSFDRKPWAVYFRHDTSPFPGQMELRYLAFSGRWFEPPRLYYHERSELQESMPRLVDESLAKAEKPDSQALEKLLQTVEDRRNERHVL